MLAVSTAMRKSEIMGLRWKDVVLNFAKRNGKDVGRISLSEKRTKTQKARVVYVHVPILEKLREHAKRRFMKTDLLFPSVRNLESDRPASIRTAFETACKKAELPDDITFHSLRHSALSHAVMSGSTMRDVMQQGGHTSPAVAARYQHLSTEHMTEVSGRLNDAIFGPLDDTEASGTED
jgi:integrase